MRRGATSRIGARRDRHLFEFSAGKRSVKFRHLEAACHHRVFPTRNGRSAIPLLYVS